MNSKFSSSEDEGIGLSLPLGFRFRPTDEELIEDFLIPKMKGQNQPMMNYVKDLANVYEYDPHQLPYKLKHARENEAFFFTNDDMKENSEEDVEGQVRATPAGYWKVYRDNVAIHGGAGGRVIGFKTKLFFHDNADGSLTDWKMNQYRCHPSLIPTSTPNRKNCVVCKIKLRTTEVAEDSVETMEDEGEDEFMGGL